MKLFIEEPVESRGLMRIYDALMRHRPENAEIVYDQRKADIIILHVVGRLNATASRLEFLNDLGKKVVLIQYSVRRTLHPTVDDWLPLWEAAHLVWSYYDLPAYCAEDGAECKFNFYQSPLGVNPTVFHPYPIAKKYIIATSGLSYLTESVRECVAAAEGKPIFHVGPNLGDRRLEYSDGIPDKELAKKYSQCEFVSGMRRTEGFEFPGVEGLFCGARPIYFDRPHYRQWFEEFAVFVEEPPLREILIEKLKEIFAAGAKPVTEDEIKTAHERFDWAKILGGLYAKCCAL